MTTDRDLIAEGRKKLAFALLVPMLHRDMGRVVEAQIGGDRRQENSALIVWALNNLTELLDAAEKAAELEAQIDRVRKVHQPIEAMNYGHRRPQPARVCSGCGTDAGNWQVYPCPTIRALTQGAR